MGESEWLLCKVRQALLWAISGQEQVTDWCNIIPATIIPILYRVGFIVAFMLMLLNATFNNISVISWRTIGGGNRRNHRPVASHIMLYGVHLAWSGFELAMLVMIGTDCIDSYKSNYHTITTIPDLYSEI
jgi:hypothetical protein